MTASVVRAFVEKKLHTLSQQHRLFYILVQCFVMKDLSRGASVSIINLVPK